MALAPTDLFSICIVLSCSAPLLSYFHCHVARAGTLKLEKATHDVQNIVLCSHCRHTWLIHDGRWAQEVWRLSVQMRSWSARNCAGNPSCTKTCFVVVQRLTFIQVCCILVPSIPFIVCMYTCVQKVSLGGGHTPNKQISLFMCDKQQH